MNNTDQDLSQNLLFIQPQPNPTSIITSHILNDNYLDNSIHLWRMVYVELTHHPKPLSFMQSNLLYIHVKRRLRLIDVNLLTLQSFKYLLHLT